MYVVNEMLFEPAKPGDIVYLADKLRQVDLDELMMLGRKDPFDSLFEGYCCSDEVYTVRLKEEPIGVFGFCKCTNCIWFLGSDLCDTEFVSKRAWLKAGRFFISRWLAQTPVLTNRISVANTLHIQWLTWMGAVFSAPYLINGYEFEDFYIIKEG